MRILKDWMLKRHIKKFGSKNNGYFNYFNHEWFEEHQTTLIFLLNHWLLKYWFRWILRIHKDCKFDETIDKIEPHTYRIKVGENTYRSDFRTHQKFSKRIYYAFRPYWYLLHALDYVIQRTIAPEFSFGFDTLTVYPDAGSDATTVDGYVKRGPVNEDFATIRGGTGMDAGSSIAMEYPAGLFSSDSTNYFAHLWRSIFTFDTSSITATPPITNGVFSVYANNYATSLGNDTNCITQVTPASNSSLSSSDYQNAFGTTEYSASRISLNATGYRSLTLNSAGLSAISPTGITKIGLRGGWDFDGTFGGSWASSTRSCLTISYADTTGTTQDPKLVVTYTVPSTFVPQIMVI